MRFYELILIIKQDSDPKSFLSTFLPEGSVDVGQIKVIKREFWGSRKFAYQIGSEKRGHYVFLGLQAMPSSIIELKDKMKNS